MFILLFVRSCIILSSLIVYYTLRFSNNINLMSDLFFRLRPN